MSGYVLVCDSVPIFDQCPSEFARWVEVQSLNESEFTLPTASEFSAALPWILTMLFLAWGFRLIVRQLLNR